LKSEDVEMWKRALLGFREKKDILFRTDNDSPVVNSDFKGLRYFDPDPKFRFEAELLRSASAVSLIMTTSKETRQLFNGIGRFDLSIEGKPVRLCAYQSAEKEDPSIFVPFRDATSGSESYPAARYLDLEVEHNDLYVVDFNYAYNPYCAYSDDYACPLPPKENWLSVAIRAGEKKYRD